MSWFQEKCEQEKQPSAVDWKCQEAFERIKDLCCTASILAFTDLKQPFVLHTNASGIGLGVVLYQVIEGQEGVIRCGSYSLNKEESSYQVHKLEFLALKWTVTMVFHEYLFGNQFTVKSDNNLLKYVLTMAQLNATGHYWVDQLASYNFMVLYKSGKTKIEADALSRIDWDWELTSEAMRVILNTTMEGCSPLAKICAHSATIVSSFLVGSGTARQEAEEAVPKWMTPAD